MRTICLTTLALFIAGALLLAEFPAAEPKPVIQMACLGLQNDPALRAQLDAVDVKWIPAGESDITYLGGLVAVPTSHCFILSEARGRASYNPDGSIAAVNDDGRLPAVEILRVPQCYDGTSVLNIFVGSASDHTASQIELPNLHPFLGASGLAGLECRAFAFSKNRLNDSSPFCVAHPDACSGDRSYDPWDWSLNTLVLGRLTRDLMAIFGGVQIQIGVGLSLGGAAGISLIQDEVASPFAAIGTRAGAGGLWKWVEEDRRICLENPAQPIPLRGIPLPSGLCSIESMAGGIGLIDEEYARLVLDLLPSDPAGARALVAAYDVGDRPIQVQRSADKLSAGGDLRTPLIIVQGTNDMAAFPHRAILAWREIMRLGKTSMARLFFLPGHNHVLGPNTEAAVRNHLEFFKAVLSWGENGTPPGPLTIVRGSTTYQALDCAALGFEFEPCKCWDAVVQSPDPALQCSPGGVDKY